MLFTTQMLMQRKSGDDKAFISTWDMPSGSVSIPSQSGTYNCVVDWGDGTTSTHTTGALTHVYASSGTRQIKISGQYNGFRINGDATVRQQILSIDQWGDVGFTSFVLAFFLCTNLSSMPSGAITGATAVTSFENCFRACSLLPSIPVGLFDKCAAVTSFSYCFSDCTSLASIPVGLFDKCAAVTSFSYCFSECTSLASIPVGLFDKCAAVTSFSFCFAYCSSATGAASELWVSHPSATGTRCFRNCTNLSNYADIPAGWK